MYAGTLHQDHEEMNEHAGNLGILRNLEANDLVLVVSVPILVEPNFQNVVAIVASVSLALAWLLARDDVIVIPKAGRRERLKQNLGALDHALTAAQPAELERLFPPPDAARSLEML